MEKYRSICYKDDRLVDDIPINGDALPICKGYKIAKQCHDLPSIHVVPSHVKDTQTVHSCFWSLIC